MSVKTFWNILKRAFYKKTQLKIVAAWEKGSLPINAVGYETVKFVVTWKGIAAEKL